MRFIFVAFSLATFFSVAQAQTKVELLPEVRAVLDFQMPSDAAMKRNAYVGLWGLYAPQGVNTMEAGAHMVRQEFTVLEGVLKTQDYESAKYDGIEHFVKGAFLKPNFRIRGQEYKLPCEVKNTQNCIAQTFMKKSEWEILTLQREENALLIERYLALQKLPEFHGYMFTAQSPFPHFQGWIQASRLRLAESIIAFKEGNPSKGFRILQEEINFSKKILASDSILSLQMLATRQLVTDYRVIDALMNEAFFQKYMNDPRLAELLKPLTPDQERLKSQTFQNNCNVLLYIVYALNTKKEGSSSVEGQQLLASLFYDNHMTSNISYLSCQPLVQRAALPLDEVSALYVSGQLPSVKDLQLQVIDEEFSKALNVHGSLNLVGKILLEHSALAGEEEYLDRIYAMQVYLGLVHAKYQLLRNGVSKNAVTAYLQKINAHNLYTQKPFEWNKRTGALSTSVKNLNNNQLQSVFGWLDDPTELRVDVNLMH